MLSKRLTAAVTAVTLVVITLGPSTGSANAAASSGPAPASRSRPVIGAGAEAALQVSYAGGALRIGGGGADPGEVLFDLADTSSSRLAVPGDAAHAFLGRNGDVMWQIPQERDPSLLWAGWSAAPIGPGTVDGDAVDLQLSDVTGPGRVEVYSEDASGAVQRRFSSDGAGPRYVRQPAGTDTHAHWVFSQRGRYTLTFRATAAVHGTRVVSAPVTYTVVVGPVVPAAARVSLTAGPALSQVGSPVMLSAAVSPMDAAGAVEFYDGTTLLGHAGVQRGGARLATSGLRRGAHPLSARFVPTYSTDFTVADSSTTTAMVSDVAPATSQGRAAPPSSAPSAAASSAGPSVRAGRTATDPVCLPTQVQVPVTAQNVTIFNEGHFDFGPQFTGGDFQSRIKKDDGTWIDPSTAVFQVDDTAKATLPHDSAYAFIGSPGSPVWVIPQTQVPGVPWLGWNTQDPSIAGHVSDAVHWHLDRLDGPGKLAIYTDGTFGGVGARILGSVSGGPSTYDIPVGAAGVHAHGNWAFTAAGVYHLSVTESAVVDGQSHTDSAVLSFFVGPGDPHAAVPTGTVTKTVGRTKDGAPCTLGTGTSAAPASSGAGGSTPPSTGGSAAADPSGSTGAPATSASPVCTPVTTTGTVPGHAAEATVFDEGHFDFGPQLIGGVFSAKLKTDTQGWLEPSGVVFQVDDTAKATLPADPAYNFIAPAGSTVWMIPQTQKAGIPWLGWNTQDPTIAGHTTGSVHWTFDRVEGPGKLAVYTDGTFGGINQRILGSVAGGPGSYDVAVGSGGVHAHGNWAFTAAGVYHVHVTETATVDGKHYTDTAVLNFAVGSTDPQSAAAGGTTSRTVTSTTGVDANGDPCALSGSSSLASTGTDAQDPVRTGLTLLGLGVVLLIAALVLGRWRRRRAAR